MRQPIHRSRTRPWRRRGALLAVAAAAVLGPAAGPASASGSGAYSVVDLGTLSGDACCSEAAAINDRGDIVGGSSVPDGNRHAFLWRNGHMTDLGALGGGNSGALDVNNRGDVVGYSSLANGATHAVLWRGGTITDLGTLAGGDDSLASAVNDRGEVVGWSATASNNGNLHAFRWRDGVMTDLGTPDGFSSVAYDVNDRGQVVGTSTTPVLWSGGAVRRLGSEAGWATAINDRGQVVGNTQPDRAFVWERGRFAEIAKPPGAMFNQPRGINNRGQVAGMSDFDAWVWQLGAMTVLPKLGGSGSAEDINNRGQLVGLSATTPDGLNQHAVLWTR